MDKAPSLGNLSARDVSIDTSGAIFRSRIFTVGELLDMFGDGKLDFICGKPFRTWLLRQRARVVENLLMGLPPTSIHLDGASGRWHVVDGSECLKAYLDFHNGKLEIKDSVILAEQTDTLTFDTLPQRLKERFLNAPVGGYILTPDCSFYDRLWFYSSALIHQAVPRTSLWDCVMWFHNDISKSVKRFAKKIGVADARILWSIILGISLSDRLSDNNALLGNSERSNTIAEKMPFDIFECISLSVIDKIDMAIGQSENARKRLRTMTEMVQSLHEYDGMPHRLNDKEICLGLAMGYFYANNTSKLSTLDIDHFINAWDLGKPYLREKTVKKYIERATEIIKIISDDTHD